MRVGIFYHTSVPNGLEWDWEVVSPPSLDKLNVRGDVAINEEPVTQKGLVG